MSAEYNMHRALVQWLAAQYPKVRFRSDLSGVKLHRGTIAKMSALNKWPGFPDLVIYEARGDFSGLAVELKAEGKSPYKKNGELKKDEHLARQNEWLLHLRAQGFRVRFATGLDEAMAIIENYLNP